MLERSSFYRTLGGGAAVSIGESTFFEGGFGVKFDQSGHRDFKDAVVAVQRSRRGRGGTTFPTVCHFVIAALNLKEYTKKIILESILGFLFHNDDEEMFLPQSICRDTHQWFHGKERN